MPATPPDFFGNLDSTRPRGNESRTLSDDYQRNMRESCKMQAPNWTGAITATHEDVNKTAGLAAANAKIMTGTAGTTIAPFANADAPIGWTIKTGFEGSMLVTAGTINGVTVAGGDTGGTDDPGLNDKVPAHDHPDTFVGTVELDGGHGHGITAGTGAQIELQSAARFNTFSTIGSNNAQSFTSASYITSADDHTHPFNLAGSVSENQGAANWVPLYSAMILCELDA